MGATTSTEEGAGRIAPTPRKTVALKVPVEVRMDLDVNHLAEIAERAGLAIMNVYNGDAEKWEVDHKADDSPLTRADKEANKIICDALMEWTPHIPIMSEENKLVPYSVRQNYKYLWIIDPLDGTKEFIKRVPHFTVNIALVEGNRPIMGVVVTPAADTMHFAVRGQGAYVRSRYADDKRISCKDFDPSVSGMTIVGSASHMSQATKDFMAQFTEPKLTQVGSSLKFLLVAEGLAHVYPRLAPTCEWDTAAAHIIVEEAGGTVVQAGRCDNKGQALEDWRDVLKRDEAVVYNKPDVLNPFFVVYSKRTGLEAAIDKLAV